MKPRRLLLPAVLIAAAFVLAHALGWREEMRFLSGTPAHAGLGVIYGCLYFAFVLIAPVLALAAAILAGLEKVVRGEEETPHV